MGLTPAAELKKDSAEFLVLAALEHESKHRYEIGTKIELPPKPALND
jgi:hypothetical protein